MRKPVIAIDGPVGSGKSTVARRAAALLGYLYLDTGAMYRAVALAAERAGVALDDAAALERIAQEARIELTADEGAPSNVEPRSSNTTVRVLLDGEDVTAAIRSPDMSQAASRVALVAGVRRVMVATQQRMGAGGGVVMEGRDIGTVVFPDAEVKVFLTASAEVRARRRLADHLARGEHLTFDQMREEIVERDRRDRERDASPLRQAPDAVLVDTSAMEVEETSRLVAQIVRTATVESG
ncbi:MAG TPA: (d)CMP kinase [Candidatus Acidoferrales bacterium]